MYDNTKVVFWFQAMVFSSAGIAAMTLPAPPVIINVVFIIHP
jgi:hypothetical protein